MTIVFMLSGMTTLKIPLKNVHADSHPTITDSSVCEKVSHTNNVPGIDRGENQRMNHPTASAVEIEQQAHTPEVDLELLARVTVGDAHGGVVPAVPELLHAEAVERRIGKRAPRVATQLVVDLDECELLLEALLDEVFVFAHRLPRVAVITRPTPGPHRIDDFTDQLVGELALWIAALQAGCLRGIDVARHRLAIRLRETRHRALTMAQQPQPQDLFDSDH
jgi:hypothetical protein